MIEHGGSAADARLRYGRGIPAKSIAACTTAGRVTRAGLAVLLLGLALDAGAVAPVADTALGSDPTAALAGDNAVDTQTAGGPVAAQTPIAAATAHTASVQAPAVASPDRALPAAAAPEPGLQGPPRARLADEAATRADAAQQAVTVSPVDWSRILAARAARFGESRLAYHQGLAFLAQGSPDRGRAELERSAQLDPSYPAPHFALARLFVRQHSPLVLGKLFDGMSSAIRGFRNQSLLAANTLLSVDLTLLVLLVWTLGVLLLRYLPFLHHQLWARLERRGHRHSRGLVLWGAILAPLGFGLGLVPTLVVALLPVWLYAGWRPRVLLTLLVTWFALQGLWPAPFGAALVGLDPRSSSSLALRAAEEPPSLALHRDLDQAIAQQPGSADLLFARGLLEAREGRFATSTASLTAGLQLDPASAVATTNLANNHFFLGDADRAVAGYQRAAALDSTQALAYYNLSQAYIKKLFFKEAGAAMKAASAHGFSVAKLPEGMPRGAVLYVRPDDAELWRLAWADRGCVAPYDLLARRLRWLGVPPDHVGLWLLVGLAGSAMLSVLRRRERLVFECANCGSLACAACSGEHDGSVLCAGCDATARRAKSELVQGTLLRNRRREAESVFQRRVRRLNAWLLGAGGLYNGVSVRETAQGLALSVLTAGLIAGGPLVVDAWDALPVPALNWRRIVCAALLLLLALLARLDRPSWRSRQLHLHPSSLVRLVDLIEGRPVRKLKT
jgi:tetratricopeptide (TPR) repeat protein